MEGVIVRYDFLKVAAATPVVKVADCEWNRKQIISMIEECEQNKTALVVFPELCITSYTCGDLFLQTMLLDQAEKEVEEIIHKTKGLDIVVVIGFPMMKQSRLYNVAGVIQGGSLLGIVPKTYLPNYAEFYEARYFTKGNEIVEFVQYAGQETFFGTNQIFTCKEFPLFRFGVEICEDLWVPIPPSSRHAMANALIIANPSASDETTGKDQYRNALVANQSARLICGYIYTSAGTGESTTDVVYSGHNIISENGAILAESERFLSEGHITYTEFVLGR